MTKSVIDVTCNRSQDAISEVEDLNEVRGVALFGRGLHVVATDSEAAIRALKKRLTERGYTVERIEAVTPLLEDVFVSLGDARDRAHDEAKEVTT